MISVKLSIYTLVFIFFFGRSLVDYGLFPEVINSYLPELIIIYLFSLAIAQKLRASKIIYLPAIGYALLFALCSLISSIYSQVSFIDEVLMLRLVMRFYFFFLALVNLNISDSDMRNYIYLIAFLFVIQIPTAAIKLMFYKQGESAIGTYATHGGGCSTSIPMIATGFLLTFFFVYRRSSFVWFLIAGFVAFGIIGGKKATFVTVPLIMIFALVSVFCHNKRLVQLYWFPLGIISCLIIAYFGVRCLPKLNPAGEFWGPFDLGYLMSYSVNYSTSSVNGVATSRGATWKKSLEHVNEDWDTILFGLGPGRVMKSRFDGVGREESVALSGARFGGTIEELGIMYGINGVCWLLIHVGYPGTIAWLCLYCYILVCLWRFALHEPDNFWRAYDLSMVCFTFTILFISFTYGSYMIMGALDPFVYFFLLSFAFVRNANVNTTYYRSASA